MTVYRTQSLLFSIRLGPLWIILLKEKTNLTKFEYQYAGKTYKT